MPLPLGIAVGLLPTGAGSAVGIVGGDLQFILGGGEGVLPVPPVAQGLGDSRPEVRPGVGGQVGDLQGGRASAPVFSGGG